jgi:2-polyprenyl-3-methyl-5-hydroxy-6-metoxy-1,4-benzoquinol methylase
MVNITMNKADKNETPIVTTGEDWAPIEIERFWNWMSHTQQRYFTEMVAPGLVKFLRRHVELKNLTLLDFGCGNGAFLEALKFSGAKLHGTDFAATSVDKAKERSKTNPLIVEISTCNSLPLKYPDNTFDIITLIETIEHLKNDYLESTLQEIYRLLKPGGKLFVTTPNKERLESGFTYCPFCNKTFHRMQHVRSFSDDSLKATLSDFRFRCLLTSQTNFNGIQAPLKHFAISMAMKVYYSLYRRPLDRSKANTPHLAGIFEKTPSE